MKTRYLHSLLGLISLGLCSPGARPACASDNSCVRTESIQPKFFPEHKSQRIRAKYGPLYVPTAGGGHEMGNYVFPIPAPCTNCLITEASGGLEYTDGKYANANTGMWLHHAVIFENTTASASCPSAPAPIFATGNERTLISISVNGTVKAGYPLSTTAQLFAAIELMNEGAPRDAVVTIEWEFIPSQPSSFRPATFIWLDADGPCLERGGEVPVPEGQAVFNLSMNPPWTADFSGDILQIASHMHDGGEELLVKRNGEVVCEGKARYGEKPGYVSSGDHSDHEGGGEGGGHHHGRDLGRRHEDMPHISSITSCWGQGRVEKGDKWGLEARYNLTRHSAMAMGGHLEPVMGISMVYVARDV